MATGANTREITPKIFLSTRLKRTFRKRLEGQWGIADVHDAVVAVKQLSSEPYSLVDPQRTAITGGSAGGYTVLKALCSYPDAFAVGTSSFGISDLFKLAEFTHKFESQYLFKLVGGTPEQVPGVYKDRSPVFLADEIKSPLLVCPFLGDGDSWFGGALELTAMPVLASGPSRLRRRCRTSQPSGGHR